MTMTSEAKKPAPIHQWLADSLPTDARGLIQRWAEIEDVGHIAVLPDVHLAEGLCIGCVVAARSFLFPDAIGSDIGCGMTAVRFDGRASLLDNADAAAGVLDHLYRCIPATRHSRRNSQESLPVDLVGHLSSPALEKALQEEGRLQFGTIGSGNHFVELQADEEENLWLMVHSGSRMMGQEIAKHHARDARKTQNGIRYLPGDSEAGRAFLDDARWAVRFASASRRAMVSAVAGILGELFNVSIVEDTLIDCPHNFVRQEEHFGEKWWVHRKGAISAQLGEWGVVPGSMGTASYVVRGRGWPESLCSSAHGAGRRMSRTDARRRITVPSLRASMQGIWNDHRKSSTLVDEAPAAYKDISQVMRAQRDLVRIERKLRPILNDKG
jgi:tRNA-splicing ligase RtcB